LDALKIKHGPTHGEIMMTDDGPCLVEMNCRCAGIDGGLGPVQRILVGHSQVDCALDSYLDKPAFAKVPDAPTVPYTNGAGHLVFLVSMNSGVIAATPGYEKIKKMKSLIRLMPEPYKAGDTLHHSVDLFSAAGVVIFASKDKAQVDADIAQCRKMEQDGTLFKMENEFGNRDVGRVRSESFDVMIERSAGRELRDRTHSASSAKLQIDSPEGQKTAPSKSAVLFLVGFMAGFVCNPCLHTLCAVL